MLTQGFHGPALKVLPFLTKNLSAGSSPYLSTPATSLTYTTSSLRHSSRSTLMLTNRSFITAAMYLFSKNSGSMTWHQ